MMPARTTRVNNNNTIFEKIFKPLQGSVDLFFGFAISVRASTPDYDTISKNLHAITGA